MKTVNINLGERSYRIYIGKGVINRLSSLIKLRAGETPLFVVTNRKINALHGKKLRKALRPLSKKILFYEVPDSEKAKSFPVYIKTIRALTRFARKTKPFVIAFGGGVIGDLTGFVASAYRRGVPYAQIPTTLLAQVDSSIGGKVAIDIEEAKNIVGDFYQPKMVLCDLQFLKTLPEKELRNGLVEIIKCGIIKDRELFSFLEKNLKALLKHDTKSLQRVVFKSSRIKAKIVEKDEFDIKDIRAVLNFGHTIGHAIEAAFRYSKSICHGRAVAEGMIKASFIALRLKMLTQNDFKKIVSLVRRVVPKKRLGAAGTKDIMNAISYDKKFIHGTNKLILPERIGSARVVDGIAQALIKEAVKKNI